MAELRSENLSKSTENHRLRRSIKKVTQELSNLQQERERLEKALEAAHQERSKGDQERERLERALEAAHQERSKGDHTLHVSAATGPLEWGAASLGAVWLGLVLGR